MCCVCCVVFVLFKQKTAYEVRISDWSSDVCSSDLQGGMSSREQRRQLIANDRQRAGENQRRRRGGRVDRLLPRQIEQLAHQPRCAKIGRASWRERVCQYV